MNEEITTQVDYAVIIFYDHARLFITHEQYRNLLNALGNPDIKNIKLGESLYYIGGISKVLTLEEFYREYPAEKPFEYNSVAKRDYSALPDRRGEETGKNGLVAMIRGINRAVREIRALGREPVNALAMREKWVQKFNLKHGELPDNLKL